MAKENGRAAFKAEKWDEAISFFTQVLVEGDPNDVSCLAIRSSAYQKKGDLESALKDADASITIQATYVRGYIRKACVLRAMKNYSDEVSCYLKGLEHLPGDESLAKGLQMAKRLKTASSKASHAAKTTQATRDAAISRSRKANKATDIASFVSETKLNLELQMVALQAQLDLVSEITGMADEEKINMLYSLITTNGHMTKLSDLVEAIKKASANLFFEKKIKSGLANVDVSKTDNDAPLAKATFEALVQDIVAKLDTSVGDFAEFVVYQVLFTGVAEEIKKEGDTKQALEGNQPVRKTLLNDERMQALFVLFDKDADSTVDFKEVAIGLYPLTSSMEESAKNATSLLLMMDKNDQRVLSYEQFAKLIVAVAAAMGMTFDELADRLALALANGDDISDEIMAEIMVAEEAYALAMDKQQEADQKRKTLDALSYSRTTKLFGLWDANGDGSIDFQELLTGLRRYQKSAMGSSKKNIADVERDALMIMGHDKDSNQALDTEEFAYAMANYAEGVGTNLHELIDFMCVVSSQADTVTDFETNYEATSSMVSRTGKFQQSLGTILDYEGSDDSEEEDDW